jgi:antirestriction protein
MTYTQAKQCIGDLGRDGLAELLLSLGEGVVMSALECDIAPEDIEEAYNGEWDSDEDFVQELLEDCGDIPSDLPHYIHIDWKGTARDIMMDYAEANGQYFRVF